MKRYKALKQNNIQYFYKILRGHNNHDPYVSIIGQNQKLFCIKWTSLDAKSGLKNHISDRTTKLNGIIESIDRLIFMAYWQRTTYRKSTAKVQIQIMRHTRLHICFLDMHTKLKFVVCYYNKLCIFWLQNDLTMTGKVWRKGNLLVYPWLCCFCSL